MDRAAADLRRPRHAMPAWIRAALQEYDLLGAYQARPPYQRNDWLAWIARAKRPETKHKRLEQALSDLRAGDVYMGMPWRPAAAKAGRARRR